MLNNCFTFEGKSLVNHTNWFDLSITYKYNIQGYRTSKIVNGVDHTYVLDGDKVCRFVNDVISYTYVVDGTLISMKLNGNEYFYITNLQGDIIELVDILGNTVATYNYDAWGNIIYQTDNDIAKKNPYRYRGYRYDEETSLYYCNSRYYNPE